jgi:PAS domain S-box-containing protein
MITVLFVDDEPVILSGVKQFLEQTGEITVDVRQSAGQALEALSRRKYDAIVSDHQVPVIDGIDFLKKVRSSGLTTPFIIFTGKGSGETAGEALNAGADFYLEKGNDPKSRFADLNDMIHQGVNRERNGGAHPGGEEIFQTIAESANDMIYIADPEGVIRYANSSCARMLNTTHASVAGKKLEEVFPPETAARLMEGVRDQMLHATPAIFEEHLVTKTADIWLSISNTPLRNNEGVITTVLGIARDITRQKRVEESLILSMRNLKSISSGTRHDINNKLTIISGYIQLMKLEDPPPGLTGYITIMERAVTDISRLLRFTKEYEKIGSEPFRWQDVHGVAEIAVSEIRHDGIELFNEVRGVQIRADMLLERVFYHLVENAIRHGKTTKSIRIRYEERTPDLYIIVEDDGLGIPPDQKERVFARSMGNNGGLGLFLCREILAATGLGIQETGLPGSGARFEIRVPPGMFRFTDRGSTSS